MSRHRVTDIKLDVSGALSQCPSGDPAQQVKILSHVVRTNPGPGLETGRLPKKKRMRSCWNRLKINMRYILRCLNTKPTSKESSGSRNRLQLQNARKPNLDKKFWSDFRSKFKNFVRIASETTRKANPRLVSCLNT